MVLIAVFDVVVACCRVRFPCCLDGGAVAVLCRDGVCCAVVVVVYGMRFHWWWCYRTGGGAVSAIGLIEAAVTLCFVFCSGAGAVSGWWW